MNWHAADGVAAVAVVLLAVLQSLSDGKLLQTAVADITPSLLNHYVPPGALSLFSILTVHLVDWHMREILGT